MKYNILFLLIICTLCLASCDSKKGETAAIPESTTIKEDSLQKVIDGLRNKTDDMSAMRLKVLNILRQISEAEGRVSNMIGEGSGEQEIEENLVFIDQKLKEYKKALADMKQLLRNTKNTSDQEKDAMQEEIESLENQLEQKNKEIALLRLQLTQKDSLLIAQNDTIQSKDAEIDLLNQEKSQQAETILSQEQDINTAWYAFGSKKELQRKHILEDGKILVSDKIDKQHFTKIDIRTKKTFHFSSKKVKLLSSHPTNSYKLEKDDNGETTLEIIDTKSFWSTSKYLIATFK